MRKRIFWLGALSVVALLVAGGLFASNMGFKLNYPLASTGTASGTNTLALPFNQQTNLSVARDLIDDIDAGAGSNVVVSVSQWLRTSDGLDTYTAAGVGNDFALTPGDAYYVVVNADANYIVVGSHAPSLGISFDAAGVNGSASGTNFYALPYHTTASVARDLIDEIDLAAGSSVVVSVSAWLEGADGLDTYTAAGVGNDFTLVPGEGYFVVVNSSVTFTPSHY